MIAQRALQSIVPPGESSLGGAAGAGVFTKSVLFTETATTASTTATHTGIIVIPAGSFLLDIYVTPIALWTASTSADMIVGDSADDNGWFATFNLKATDLVLGERLQASQAVATDGSYGGAKEGAYLTTAGRFGAATGTGVGIGGYFATAGSVIGVVTRVGTTGAAGRTLLTVQYIIPNQVAPVVVTV